MATSPYSGASIRAGARYSTKPPVPGINPEHLKPDPDPDPFQPQIDAESRPGDVWQPEEVPVHTEMRDRPISHWTNLHAPVPSSVPSHEAGIATTVRMLANHGVVDYRPEKYQRYRHATQGLSIEYTPGRMPWQAGEDVPENLRYLVMGTNAYDATNAPTEVYSGDAANVGRYRVGTDTRYHGLYELPYKVGQDAEMRAYTELHPQLPVDKPRIENSAPYTPNSSGTARWTLPSFQTPSLFALPSETAVTDYITTEPSGSQFDDGGRM